MTLNQMRMKSKHFYENHRIIWFIIFTVALTASVWVWNLVPAHASTTTRASTAAHATTANKGICLVGDNPDLDCWSSATAAQKFRDGYYIRANGMPVNAIYTDTTQARINWDNRLQTWVDYHPSQAATVKAATPTYTGNPCPSGVANWICDLYKRVVLNADCVSGAPNPTTAVDICANVFLHPFDPMDIKTGAKVIGCGGTIVIGIYAAKAGTAPLIAGWGGAVCTTNIWADWVN